MDYELRKERGLTLVGIACWASNASPERIGDVWRRFDAMGGAKAIEGRLDDAVYGVYCEYESDWTASMQW